MSHYTIPEAARWTQIPSGTLRRWLTVRTPTGYAIPSVTEDLLVVDGSNQRRLVSFDSLVGVHNARRMLAYPNVRWPHLCDIIERHGGPETSCVLASNLCLTWLKAMLLVQGTNEAIELARLWGVSYNAVGKPTAFDLPNGEDTPLLRIRLGVAFGDPLFIRGGGPITAMWGRRTGGESIESIAADYGASTEDTAAAFRVYFDKG